jgi:hypothetical protein
MNKPRFASLTAGLLARKGEAEPAATPFADQLLTRVGMPAVETGLAPMRRASSHHLTPIAAAAKFLGDGLAAFGKRDASPAYPPDVPSFFTDPPDDEFPPPPALIPKPELRASSFAGDDGVQFVAHAKEPAPGTRAHLRAVSSTDTVCKTSGSNCPAVDEGSKVYHVNLRLKRARYVRLKLAAALTRRPTQEIVAEALDAWFATMPVDLVGDCACLAGRGDCAQAGNC